MKDIVIKLGDIVVSKAGHDKGTAYAVIKIISDDFCLLADGRLKKQNNPKLKRFKHLKVVASEVFSDSVSDKALRETLKKYDE